ncbi:MAG: hypothetical protein IT423_20020 [Pirellulaceae bacterium]|nr:hypothetical protein [Pirellulaceae bacterium]
MRRKYSLRSLLVCVTIVAIHIAVTRAFLLIGDEVLEYRGVPLVFLVLAVLPAIDLAAYLALAQRTPISDFFTLSIFAAKEPKTACVGLSNIVSVACSASLALVLLAFLLFPDMTDMVIRVSGIPLERLCTIFDPERSFLFEVVGIVWYSAIIGALWVCIFAGFFMSVLKVCFAIHLRQSGNLGYERCSRISFADALPRQESTNQAMDRSRG